MSSRGEIRIESLNDMGDTVQAIDVIFKLIPQLKSFTGTRRREYFETLVAPLFDSLEKVHEFYNGLFLQTRRDISDLYSEALGLSDSPSIEQVIALRKLKESFLLKRQQDEHLRDALRQEAKQIFLAIRWTEERRFLASLTYYFLGKPEIAPSNDRLDQDVQSVIKHGGNSCWDTPSTLVYAKIKDEYNLERLLEIFDESRNAQNQLYMNARHHFRTVQHWIIMNT